VLVAPILPPNFPYNIAGNAYDGNGFDSNGLAQDNFELEWQPTSYPQYASDPLHGFASDQFLNEDGVPLYKELGFQTVISISQAQRCAKIALLRNRQQGSGTFGMSMAAYQMMPTDVMEFTFPAQGWTEKTLEVSGMNFRVVEDQGGAPSVRCSVSVIETDESVYDWDTVNELTILDAPAAAIAQNPIPAPPTDMVLTSGAVTAVINADGTVQPRIEVQWSTPLDVLVTQIQVQYQQVGAATWIAAAPVDASLNQTFIPGVVAGQQYNVRIRSARANGAVSAFEEIDGFTVSITISVTGMLQVAPPGTLIGEAFSGGAADILVEPFTATIAALSVSCLPAGIFTITGLSQAVLYFVYYIDPTFAGGAITPIATTNSADFLDKVGFFLIGSLVTPVFGAGGGSGVSPRFSPSSFSDVGSRTTVSPANAYDGNSSSFAKVSGTLTFVSGGINKTASGDCIWQGFPSFITTVACDLHVTASVSSSDMQCTLIGAGSTMISAANSVALATHTVAIPIGTNISTIMIEAIVDGASVTGAGGSDSAFMEIFEIWIQ
jgi:hypothetical protein